MAARPRFSTPAQAIRASSAIRHATEAAGGPARLAQHLGLAVTAVPRWTFCPAEHVEAVEAVSGVSRCRLRPDLYPRAALVTRALTPDEAAALHLMAGAFFARTGRCLSAEEGRS